MIATVLRNLPAQAALAAIACVAIAAPVAAQTTVKEVTVEAPRTVTTRVETNTPPGGAQVEVTTIKIRVGYGDLDLAKSSDVATLGARIKAAAKTACEQLDKLYPLHPDDNCVSEAVVTTTAQVAGAIAAVGR